MQSIDRYLTENSGRFLDELKSLLRIPSVSAQSHHNTDTRRAAEFVREQLASAGLNAELIETKGHPIVYAEWLQAPGAPTALIYGHYDVQPPDPLDKWISPPFEPTVRDGLLFARGATDDKGQMYTHVKSLEAWLKAERKLPINVKVVIEGEEEVGSDNLDRFLDEHKARLKSDVAVISDTSQFAPGVPAITYGLRGIVACEVVLHGPNQDLHSGIFGGSVANPVNALARLVGALHDEHGRVQVPGFYDDVQALTTEEREWFAKLPFNEEADLKKLGVSAGWGEEGFTTLERRWARPTCDVNGITGGYQGEGPKTIVPSWARAKITCRLVPNQDPQKVVASLEAYLKTLVRPGLRFEFQAQHGCPASAVDIYSPYISAARKAIQTAFGVEPVMIREGGSIPVVATLKQILGIDTLLLGWGQNTDNLHSPNEHFRVDDFQRGIRASAHLWQALAESKGGLPSPR